MIKCFLPLIVLLLSGCTNKQADEPLKEKREKLLKAAEKDPFAFTKYCNDRFTYCIGYPVFILFPGNESSNGDGRIFADKKGEEVLRVYGKAVSGQYKEQVLAGELTNDLQSMERAQGITVSEKRISENGYIISGSTISKLFVKKTILKNGVLASAVLHYNKNEKNIYDKVADKIIASLE